LTAFTEKAVLSPNSPNRIRIVQKRKEKKKESL